MHKFSALALSILCCTASIIAQQKPVAGENTPNVKMVDCDEFNTFHEGYCIVTKGNKKGLIDSLGNMVIKYTDRYLPVEDILYEGFRDGMLPVVDVKTNLQGYMNKQLKLVIPCIYISAGHFTNGYGPVDKNLPLQPHAFVSKTGAEIKKVNNNWGEVPLFPVNGVGSPGGISGFEDQFGKRVFNFKFDRARTFSGGLAAVMRLDEVGKPKWGFIDTKGKIVIGLKYSLEPGDFREGLAIVVPATSDDVAYAYIDKTGTVKLSVSIKDGQSGISNSRSSLGVLQYGVPPAPLDHFHYETLGGLNFLEGLAFLKNDFVHAIYMDTLGNKHIYPDVKDSGYIDQPVPNPDPKDHRLRVVWMSTPFLDHLATFKVNSYNGSGLMNDQNKILIDPVFDNLEAPLPGQKLLKAKINRGNMVSASNPNKYGFVNLKGEFVILKAAAATW